MALCKWKVTWGQLARLHSGLTSHEQILFVLSIFWPSLKSLPDCDEQDMSRDNPYWNRQGKIIGALCSLSVSKIMFESDDYEFAWIPYCYNTPADNFLELIAAEGEPTRRIRPTLSLWRLSSVIAKKLQVSLKFAPMLWLPRYFQKGADLSIVLHREEQPTSKQGMWEQSPAPKHLGPRSHL